VLDQAFMEPGVLLDAALDPAVLDAASRQAQAQGSTAVGAGIVFLATGVHTMPRAPRFGLAS
jgi:hypothetical protein